MPRYLYKIVTKENKLRGGVITASSKGRAQKMVAKDGATVILLYRERDSIFDKEIGLPGMTFSTYELILFFRNLSTMISAGISLSSALHIFEDEAKKKMIKKTYAALAHEVENGKALSASMKKFPRYFPEFLVETVAVGEVSGRMSRTFEKIAEDLERDYELSRKVRGAMAYPIVIVTVMIAVVSILIVYVLPKIVELFQDLNASLPLPTRLLIGMGTFFGKYPYILPLFFMALGVIFFFIRRQEKTRYMLHMFILKVPIFGDIVRDFNLARIFRSLESLLSAGISLVRALEVSQKTLKSDPYKKALQAVGTVVLHGGKFAEALRPYPFLFPAQTRHIVDVGERTGKFDEIFGKLTYHYERSLHHKTQMLTALIEPILMVVVGVVVGGIALAIFLPIYQTATIL